MARNRQKFNLTKEIQDRFDSMLAIGRSKHKDKLAGATADKIYSWNTYRTYLKHANYFAKWCKEQHGCRTLAECRPYADEWLQSRAVLSAYTQKLEVSTLAKMYGCTSKDFVAVASRKRSDITRSRGEKIRDKNFSEERNSELVSFCRSTGLRRAELRALTGDKLRQDESGNYYIVVDSGSKGGRYREAPVIGNVDNVVRLMNAAGSGKVFSRIHNGADIHSYRADYATAIYKAHARKIEDIPFDRVNAGSGFKYQSGVYCRRGDNKGSKLDKEAMLIASRALGHNRISVIGEHYLRGV